MKALVQVVRLAPVNKFCHNLPVPHLIELIHEHTVELAQILDDTHDNFEERVQVRGSRKLVVRLRLNVNSVRIVLRTR